MRPIRTDEKMVPKVTPASKVRGREVVTPKPAAPTKKEEKKVPESPKNQEEHPILEGQSDIRKFAETMPVTYENAENEEKTEPAKVAPASEVRGRDQIEAEQKEAAEPVEVVPDAVDGECQYCCLFPFFFHSSIFLPHIGQYENSMIPYRSPLSSSILPVPCLVRCR